MLHTGAYELTIDEKKRLSIPAAIRNSMDPKVDGTGFYLVLGDWPGTLGLFGNVYFKRYAKRLATQMPPGQQRQIFVLACHHPAEQLGNAAVEDAPVGKAGEVVAVGEGFRPRPFAGDAVHAGTGEPQGVECKQHEETAGSRKACTRGDKKVGAGAIRAPGQNAGGAAVGNLQGEAGGRPGGMVMVEPDQAVESDGPPDGRDRRAIADLADAGKIGEHQLPLVLEGGRIDGLRRRDDGESGRESGRQHQCQHGQDGRKMMIVTRAVVQHRHHILAAARQES